VDGVVVIGGEEGEALVVVSGEGCQCLVWSSCVMVMRLGDSLLLEVPWYLTEVFITVAFVGERKQFCHFLKAHDGTLLYLEELSLVGSCIPISKLIYLVAVL
jgi:hypothetical protein